jgi:hypothetical protein
MPSVAGTTTLRITIKNDTNHNAAMLSVNYTECPGDCFIKLITAVIYGFRNKLECLSLNTTLGWNGLPGTNNSSLLQKQ